jgi:hypothetical protein
MTNENLVKDHLQTFVNFQLKIIIYKDLVLMNVTVNGR